MSFTEFSSLSANSVANLAAALETALADGWQPYGSVVEEEGAGGTRFSIVVAKGAQAAAIENTLPGITADSTELNQLDGATVANSTASKAAVLDAGKALRTAANVGTAGTGFTAVEYGDGYNHVTVLTAAATLPAIAGGAALAVGLLAYTLPAGAAILDGSRMDLAITQSEGNITADTPDVGLGTVIASGAVATLDGTATFEDLITGQTAADCNGTASAASSLPTGGSALLVQSADAHTVHVNVADLWAAGGDAGAALTGTVVLAWRFLG